MFNLKFGCSCKNGLWLVDFDIRLAFPLKKYDPSHVTNSSMIKLKHKEIKHYKQICMGGKGGV